MPTYKLTARRQMGKITKGYTIQVPSRSLSQPARNEVEAVLKALGFTDTFSLQHATAGNWKIEKLG